MQSFSAVGQIANRSAAPDAGPTPVLFSTIAFGCCALVLAGWFLGVPELTGFGNHHYPMQPLTAAALALVALAQAAAMRGRRVLTVAILLAPVSIAAAALAEHATGVPAWFDASLFGDIVSRKSALIPKHPGTIPAVAVLMVAAATLISLGNRRHHGQLVVLIASLTLGVAVIAGASIPLGLDAPPLWERHASMSIPTAASIAALAMALISWRRYFGWLGLLSTHGLEGRTLRTIFGLCVLAPIVFALAQLWALNNTAIPLNAVEILRASAQITISAAILIWAWSRLAREHVARWEVTRALDSAPVVLVDVNGRVVHWSEGCERLYGWAAAEALGQPKHVLTGAADASRWETIVRALDAGRPWEEEVTEFARWGAQLRVIEQARLLQAREDSDPVIVLSMTDITARTNAEEALRASDARLGLAVESLEIGIFEWEVATNQLRLSGDAERLLGPAPAMPGFRRWREQVRQHFDSKIVPSEREVAEHRLPRFSFRLSSKAGATRTRTIEGWARCVYSPEGRLMRMIGIMFDATEREEREATLQARESELRSILETVPDAMVTIDEQGHIRSFSATAEALFGYKAHEVLGHNITLLMPERYRNHHDELLTRYLKTGEPYLVGRTRTMTALHRNGAEIPIELAVGEAYNGNVRVFIGFVRNISEQLAAQARLGELRDQLLHVSRLSAMGEMAAGLAHELNQPLAAITNFLGAAEMLLAEDAPRGEHVRDLVQLASGQVLRAGNIIRRVRNFVAKGEVEIGVEPLEEIASEAVHLVLAGAQNQKVNIRYDLDRAHPLVLADRVQVQQVLVNVVRNALEALRDGSDGPAEIVLASRGISDGMVMMSVSDNGPGISTDILERPFEPFASTKAYGMGVGLSICRRIIESHGGSFSAQNRPGGGAVICFSLPAVAQTELMAG
ncbi:PAS domain S-box protein [Sphingomonas sp. LaA6.9]|uniref:PAS domain-containing sensor histidine kinase n=1 Tax=Sphingomonas sp. LaA6.9 TaxID=2919914 RepID=UPI001F4F1B48|nr:PAS domain S-box protein [Sphingomonas sp. LaA6.9]MCJ8158688.1 PAS domain S-box protein [Sphingomonas sp. LaA6.9]